MKTGYSLRYTTLGAIFALIGILIVSQLIRFQIGPQAEIFRQQGDIYSGEWHILTPVRGQIYDRWGHLLAGNKTVYEVGVELQFVQNPDTIALAASVVLGLDYDWVYRMASQPYSENAVYVVLKKNASVEQVDQLKALVEKIDANPGKNGTSQDGNPHSLRGLVFSPFLQRTYPELSLASNVLGFVNIEDEGYFGIESHYNDLLSGVEKPVWLPSDPNRATELPETPGGASLILTLDREIQASVEKILDAAVQNSGSETGTIIVMDPETGDILAMASTPHMNPNEYWDLSDTFQEGQYYNKAIGSYEPGSVFKVITMAAALDSGTVEPDTPFLDTGYIEIGGVPIYNWNRGAWGPQTMLGCMQHSLNVCLAWVSSQMGAATFYDYLQNFGFGHPTGIELDGEVTGHLKLPGDSDWYEADLGTNAFGQGISVTPIQMLMAISAVANDGKMMTPRILQAVVDNNRQYNTSPQVAGTPISAETAHVLTNMLTVSLEEEASTALVEGYRIAGKTGTAEIPTPFGYTSSATNASFVGWGPVDDPQFLVYIWLEKPTSSPWGSEVAAPVFSEIVQRLVVLMDLPPDQVRQSMAMP